MLLGVLIVIIIIFFITPLKKKSGSRGRVMEIDATHVDIDATKSVNVNVSIAEGDVEENRALYYVDPTLQISQEICIHCKKPMVLTAHTGHLTCSTRRCKRYGQKIHVLDGDVATLPFGLDGTFSSILKSDQPDYKYVRDNNAEFSFNKFGITKAAGKKKKNVGNSMRMNPEVEAIKANAHFKHVEVVFGLDRKVRRTVQKRVKLSSYPANHQRYSSIQSSQNSDSSISSSSSASSDDTISMAVESDYSLTTSMVLEKPTEEEPSIDMQSWIIPQKLLKLVATQLCKNTCAHLYNEHEFAKTHAHFDGKCCFVSLKSRNDERPINEICSSCYWVKNPINISELKLVISQIHYHTGDNDWMHLYKNDVNLNKAYCALYDLRIPSLDMGTQRKIISTFNQAKKDYALISNEEETILPHIKVATSQKTATTKSYYDPNVKKRIGQVGINAMRHAQSITGGTIVPMVASSDLMERKWKSKQVLQNSLVAESHANSNMLKSFKAAAVWFVIFNWLYSTNYFMDTSEPDAWRNIHQLFPIILQQSKMIALANWWKRVCKKMGWECKEFCGGPNVMVVGIYVPVIVMKKSVQIIGWDQ